MLFVYCTHTWNIAHKKQKTERMLALYVCSTLKKNDYGTIDFFHIKSYVSHMKNVQLQNVVWKEGKYYVAQCLNIDISSFGKTKKEALTNLDEALELFLEDMPQKTVAKVERPEIVRVSLQYA